MQRYSLKPEALTPLMGEWLEFESNSFQGFLVTLSLEEVQTLQDEIIDRKEKSFAWSFIIDKELDQEFFSLEDLNRGYSNYVSAVTLILLVKKGLCEFKVADNEDDWTYKLCKEGEEEADRILRKINKRLQ